MAVAIMSKAKTPFRLADAVLEEILEISEVRADARPQARLSIQGLMGTITDSLLVSNPNKARARSSLRKVTNAARDLALALDGLPEFARRMLLICLDEKEGRVLVPENDGSLRPITIEHCKMLARDLVQGSKDAEDTISYQKKRLRGAPRGHRPRNYPFHFLIFGLKRAIVFEGGGTFSLKRPAITGTAVAVLEILSRNGLKHVLPSPIPWGTVEKLIYAPKVYPENLGDPSSRRDTVERRSRHIKNADLGSLR
jgi:hypothetical protein